MKEIDKKYGGIIKMKKEVSDAIIDHPRIRNHYEHTKRKTYWYAEVISTYALYFEHEIFDVYSESPNV